MPRRAVTDDEYWILRDVWKKIKLLRIDRGETQEQLAEAICCDRSYVSYAEKHGSNTSLITLIKISEHYNVKLDDLISRSNMALFESGYFFGPKTHIIDL